MDFKNIYRAMTAITLAGICLLQLSSCGEREKKNTENTYYIELVNFTNDSLKTAVSASLFGKAAYYKGNKLEVLSMNYVTDDLPEMHYFENAALLKDVKPETKKIRVGFERQAEVDSVSYSLQKFRFRDNQWIKTSDMGVLNAGTDYQHAIMNELARQIMHNVIMYTYDQ